MIPLNMKDGGVVGKVSDWITETTGIETPGLDRRIETPGLEKAKNAAWAAVDFVPIIGDIKGAWELTQEVRKDPINWVAVGALTAGLVIGLVPGVGDAIAGLLKRSVQALGQAGILTVESLVSLLKAAKTGDEAKIKAHIAELTKQAEEAGWKVKNVDEGFHAGFNKDADGNIVKGLYIPKGFSKNEYLIALEEFSHALDALDKGFAEIPGNRAVGGQQLVGGARLSEEIRAKVKAYESASSRVTITPEDLKEWSSSFRSYLGIPFEWKDVTGYGDDAIKQLYKIPDDVWKLMEFPKPNIDKLMARDREEWINYIVNLNRNKVPLDTLAGPQYGPDGVSLAARSATPRPFFIKNADGTVEEVSMTPAEFREAFGVGSSAVKKDRGRTGDGLQWSKDPEGFGDKRTASGNALIDTQVERLGDVSMADATSAKRYLPRALSDEDKLTAKLMVDDEIADAALKFEEENTQLVGINADEWFDARDGWVNKYDHTDYDKTKETAFELAETAWPNIKRNLEENFSHLSNEEFNKVLQWARSRSRNAFSIRKSGPGGEFKGTEDSKYLQRLGAVDRREQLMSDGTDQVKRSEKVAIRSGGITKWVDPKEIDNPTKTHWTKEQVRKNYDDIEALYKKYGIEPKYQIPTGPNRVPRHTTDKERAIEFATTYGTIAEAPEKILATIEASLKKQVETGVRYGPHDPDKIRVVLEAWKRNPKKPTSDRRDFLEIINGSSNEMFDDFYKRAKKDLETPFNPSKMSKNELKKFVGVETGSISEFIDELYMGSKVISWEQANEFGELVKDISQKSYHLGKKADGGSKSEWEALVKEARAVSDEMEAQAIDMLTTHRADKPLPLGWTKRPQEMRDGGLVRGVLNLADGGLVA